MGMNQSSNAYQNYEQAQSFEQQRIRVLDGSQAKAREDARRGRIVRTVLTGTAVFLCLLTMAFMSAKICGIGVEINNMKDQIAAMETDTLRAEMDLGELSSLSRIESYAINNLGMVYPGAENIHIMDEESSMAIARGEQALAASASDAVTAENQKTDIWTKIGIGIANFFTGKASAAEY